MLKCLPAFLLLAAVTPATAEEPAAKAPAPAPVTAPASTESPAEATLKQLVARENELLTKADPASPKYDAEEFRSQMQQLIDDYAGFIRLNPGFTAAYVAYGRLLLRHTENRRKEGAALLLKANELDPNLAIVKNELGSYCAEEALFPQAAAYFFSAIQLEPKEPLYHFQLASLLYEARDDLLKSGLYTREQLDRAMHEGFRQAAALAPDSFSYAYRYGESFYDLASPDWDEALRVWQAIEQRVSPGLEQQTIRLHEANVLIKLGRTAAAIQLLNTVTEDSLAKQRQKLIDLLNPKAEK